MSGKWTPGPWRIGRNFRSIIADADTGWDDQDSVLAYGGHMVCESVHDANAHLIAAAPDLYEALEVIGRELAGYLEDELALVISAALAKARGEA